MFREPERASSHMDTAEHPEESRGPRGCSAQGKAEPSSPPALPQPPLLHRKVLAGGVKPSQRAGGGGRSKRRKTQP